MKLVKWFKMDDDYSEVGEYPPNTTPGGDYICPQCGQPCDYWEGQIDQDYMGNDIHGWSFDCLKCGIHSEAKEGGFND